jgi:hypothetical protein
MGGLGGEAWKSEEGEANCRTRCRRRPRHLVQSPAPAMVGPKWWRIWYWACQWKHMNPLPSMNTPTRCQPNTWQLLQGICCRTSNIISNDVEKQWRYDFKCSHCCCFSICHWHTEPTPLSLNWHQTAS